MNQQHSLNSIFGERKLLILLKSNLPVFSFMDCAFGIMSNNHFLLGFHKELFYVLYTDLWSILSYFLHKVRFKLGFFAYRCTIASTHRFLKTFPFSLNFSLYLGSRLIGYIFMGLFLDILFQVPANYSPWAKSGLLSIFCTTHKLKIVISFLNDL